MDKENPRGGKIYELLPLVMADIGAIGKEKKNTQQNYKFRGIDDALNAVNPALVKHGVAMAVEVTNHILEPVITVPPDANGFSNPKQCMIRATLLLRLTFFGPDGSSISNVTAGEALDYNGDKATNKAMSAAAKYAFFLGLCIPLEEHALDDSDHDSREPEPPARQHNGNGYHANGNGHASPPVAAQPPQNGAGEKTPEQRQVERIAQQISLAATPQRVQECRATIDDPRRQLSIAAKDHLVGLCIGRTNELNAIAARGQSAVQPPGF